MHPLRIAALLAFTLLASAVTSSKVEAQKIGVVDLQRALNDTEDGRKAKATLKKLFDSRQKSLDKQQDDLRAMKETLEKQKDVLSKDVLGKKLQEYQKQLMQLQQTYVEFQRELAAKEGELTKGIIDQMQAIVRRIGQAEGYTMIVERNEAGVIFTPSSYDLTDVVIQRYNSGEGGKGRSKPKASAKKK